MSKIFSIFPEMEDKNREARSKEPAEIHRGYIDKQIADSGITTETVSQIKQGDKEGVAKLDKLETILEEGEEKGVLTEKHKKMKTAIAAHKATLKPGETKPPVTGSDDKDTGTTGSGSTTTGGDNKKPEDTATTKPDKK